SLINDLRKIFRRIEMCGNIKWVFPESLLYPSSKKLRRIAVHHPKNNTVSTYTRGLLDDTDRIFVIFKSGDKSYTVERIILEWHKVRICHGQIAVKQVFGLR